mmetsp:Transcript_13784/g.32109  ORF Transcript_13784/g.32109 Transcript_13784/m.32109 type:complete len:470 (-) Transcript_13784:16-1425(-)
MEAKRSGVLGGEVEVNVIEEVLPGALCLALEALKQLMALLVELRDNESLEVGHARAAVPLVGNVATIHDLAENVFEVSKRHGVRGAGASAGVEHVDGDLGALLEVAHGEAVDVAAGPPDEAKLAAAIDKGVEAGEGEEHPGEVCLTLALVDESLVKRLPGAEQVGAERLGRLVGDFDGVLQDGLGDGLLRGERGRLRREEAAEVGVSALLRLLKLALQGLDPHGHEVDVLQEDPAALLHAAVEGLLSHGLLPLPHRDVDKLAVVNSEALLLEEGVNVAHNVCTGEQVEEHGGLGCRLAVDAEDVEGLLIDKHLAKVRVDHVAKASRHAVRAHGAQKAHLLKGSELRVVAGGVLCLWGLELHPLVPELGGGLHVGSELGKGPNFDQTADALPNILRKEGAELHVHGGWVHVLGAPRHVSNLCCVERTRVFGRGADIGVAEQDLEEDGGDKEKLVLIEEATAGKVVDLGGG